ncbi:MAG: GAF domain-containing protein [Chloroflexota bacterium]|nr:GAF domain-containing protein [Chloroflexota bacterium]
MAETDLSRTWETLETLDGESGEIASQLRESYASLERRVRELERELAETLEQEAATGEILKVISHSAADLQAVFETVVCSARRLCAADGAQLYILHGDLYHLVVADGGSRQFRNLLARNPISPGRGTLVGRVALDRETVQIGDVLADPEYTWREAQSLGGVRTLLGVPMLREGVTIGVIVLIRTQVRPFTERQMELLTTFAAQGVIAIEKARLFAELQERSRDLASSVEQL